MTDNVKRFPIQSWQRVTNRRGKRSVSCTVSDRWLRFGELGIAMDIGTPIEMHVMTDVSGSERKMTTLIVTIEELRKLLQTYEKNNG